MIAGKSVSSNHPREVWVRHTYNVSETPQRVSTEFYNYDDVGSS